jgi:uncharacterized membrane protein
MDVFLQVANKNHIMHPSMSGSLSSKTEPWVRGAVLTGLLAAMAAWMYVAPPGALGKLDAIGYAVCHRLDSHSLHMGALQMPLCARCTGEFSAAAIALIFQGLSSPRTSLLPRRSIAAALSAFFVAFALDGANSYLGLVKSMDAGAFARIPVLYKTSSVTRVLTGSGMGVALAALLYPMYNQSVWRNPTPESALGWSKFLRLMGIVLVVDLAMLTENPAVLYPVAVLSTLGVLGLLSMVFSIVWIMAMRQDNGFETARQLWLPAAAGLTLALVMILGIDLVRFNLTHTWGGFPGLQG